MLPVREESFLEREASRRKTRSGLNPIGLRARRSMEINGKDSALSPPWSSASRSLAHTAVGQADFRCALAKARKDGALAHSPEGKQLAAGNAIPDAGADSVLNASYQSWERRLQLGASESGKNPVPAPALGHVVRSGETLYRISRSLLEARGADISPAAVMRAVSQLSQANGISNPDRIYPNQRIDASVLNGYPSKAVDAANAQSRGTDTLQPVAFAARSNHLFEPVQNCSNGIELCDDPNRQPAAFDFLGTSRTPVSQDLQDQDMRAGVNLIGVETRRLENGLENGLEANETETWSPAVGTSRAKQDIASGYDAGRPQQQEQVAATGDAPRALTSESRLPDVLYKGVLGKALDFVPMNPDDRVTLQQTSSIISASLSGRMLAGLFSIANPIALVAGLAWGLFSAKNIEPAPMQDKE